ncbi:hypothetical protein [Calothrix sp. NIES-3974]|uniref:hypothetical protein n=1 Tax=Calothrix sp. NIES-3974 TaxID=2005462 RepID=UPI000B60299E|nr:hypothetical protein [Calothrix sp. NIES-3974]BAZ05958.1 hypothetical protein NIES3974_26150 [Calothrix sp. NIES-3974]
MKKKLEYFQEKLISLPEIGLKYAEMLRRLEKYQNIILIYTRDYTDKLQEVQSISPGEDLSFLSFFTEQTSLSFQEEISAELQYFHHGFSLIDKAIASIRGQVAIEQTKREREEQVLIFALSTGIAVGGNVASSIQVALPEHNEDKGINGIKPENFFMSFFASLIFSVIIGLLIWKYFGKSLERKKIIHEDDR